LRGEFDVGTGGGLAEVAGVDEEALFAAGHGQGEFGDGDVGDGVESGADAAVDGVDASDQVGGDLAAEEGDEVGQRVIGGAQDEVTFNRVVEQGRDRLGVTVDRGGGTGVGAELDPRTDGADMSVLEELRAGSQDGRSGARALQG
jgi:hypothetical protein